MSGAANRTRLFCLTDRDDPAGHAQLADYVGGGGTDRLLFRCRHEGEATTRVAVERNSVTVHGSPVGATADYDVVRQSNPEATRTSSIHGMAGPTVSGLSMNDPGGDGLWEGGTRIELKVTFSEAVNVIATGGTPYARVNQLFGSGDGAQPVDLPYERVEGGDTVVFAGTAAGLAGRTRFAYEVRADTLRSNRGVIVSAATGAIADLSHRAHASASALVPPCGSSFPGEIWCADLTVGEEEERTGYSRGRHGTLSNTRLRRDGMNITVDQVLHTRGGSAMKLRMQTNHNAFDREHLRLHVGTRRYPLSEATVSSGFHWNGASYNPNWSVGDRATVRLTGPPASSEQAALDPPTVTGGPAVSGAGDDGTWREGETVRVALTFSEPVDVDTTGGTPSLGIGLGGRTARSADYESGGGTQELAFAYTLVKADGAHTMMSVRPDSLALGGGTIRGSRGALDAALGHAGALVSGAGARGAQASAEGAVESEDAEPIIARFTRMPAEHDGASAFVLEFAFSHEPRRYSFKTVHRHLFDVTGGRIEKASRLVKGSNLGWAIRVRPDGLGDVTLAARATTDCQAQYAACDAEGRLFDGELETTVLGPPTLSVADAEVEEADGATLDFTVTLSRALDEAVTVRYATADGTAASGSDYTAASGTLAFATGEVSKTVSVAVLDDPHDEGSETLTLALSDPSPARVKLADAEATGTIANDDPMPRAWIARFGRTVADQVLDAVESRMRAARSPGVEVSLAGERIGWRPGAEDRTASAAPAGQVPEAASLADWLRDGTERNGAGPGSRTATGREFLWGSSFMLAGEAGGPGSGGGAVALWGRGAVSGFEGRDGDLTVDGEVASAMLGADWSRGPAMLGLIVGRSTGEGDYRAPAGAGVVKSTLTGVYPWGRHALTEGVEIWGAAGYGAGTLTLTPDGEAAMRTDLDLWMAAVGLRGALIDPGSGSGAGGPTLLAKTDAMTVETSTDAVRGDLAASEAGVTRLRLGLEAALPLRLADGSVLTPGAELGVRHDGGDAETGFGTDIGGSLAWADPTRGLSAELRGRGLLTHEAKRFRERGLSGSLGWDPVPGERGPRLSLTQTFGGPSSGGADALLARRTLAGLAENGNDLASRRLEAKLGYGFAAFGDRFTLAPEARIDLSGTAREYGLSWRLTHGEPTPGAAFALSSEALRRESPGDDTPPEHGIGLRLDARF